jgi:hypothetical protein
MLRRFGLLLLLSGFAQAQIANLAIDHYLLPNDGTDSALRP